MATLTTYAARRSFKDTPEPAPAARVAGRGPLMFVIQQHSARRMHFDFRLELDGVLKSWAVPRGLAIAPGDRHLAVMTEDHPFDYGSFEGVIPPRQYGAGPVIVWDCGLYSPDESARGRGVYSFHDREEAAERMRRDLEKGKLGIFLLGAKLKGSYALVRTRQDKDWLLIKHRDPYVDIVVSAAEKHASVLCGLTVEQMRDATPPPRVQAERLVPFGPAEPVPKKLLPMLARVAEVLPEGPGWLYEPKLDGYRVIATVTAGGVKLQSRRGLDMTRPFPDIAAELGEMAQGVAMVLDGELLALGPDGKPSFNALQNRAQLKSDAEIARAVQAAPCIFALFDVLHYAGMDLRRAPYRDRARYLSQIFLPQPHLQRVEAGARGPELYRAALEAGFEGAVAKRVDGVYEPGARVRHWVKVKAVQTEEFYIGGYAEGRGSRADRFGSLLVGTPENNGKLKYAGRVGSGFDERLLNELRARFDALKTARHPFTEKPPLERPTTWLKPELVAEIKFAEWTADGHLRAPVFLRLREDAEPRAARRAGAAAKQESAAASDPSEADDAERRLLLAALEGRDAKSLVKIRGGNLSFTNLDKVLWPADAKAGVRAYTKRDFLRYVVGVSPYLLPHIKDRPVTMIRMPEGIGGERFFQKHWERSHPSFVETITVFSESKDESHDYFLCQNLPTLAWLAQIGTLEFHIWHSRASFWPEAAGLAGEDHAGSLESLEASILNRPDWVVFDIDPYIYSGKEAKGAEPEYNARAFEKGKEVAFRLKEVLDGIGLKAIAKTSGKTGLHIFVPIVRTLDFAAVRQVSMTISEHLRRAHPKDITTEWSTVKRTGKIFMDYNMNARAKTLNVAYSPRGVPGAPVSMPLSWEELAKAQPMDFTLENAVEHLQKRGDRWKDALVFKQNLEALVNFWKG
jgi:bifunctional non-homologous end joining protein LigD